MNFIKKHKSQVIGTLLILLLLAWSPWITKSYAEEKMVNEFNKQWEGISDGCGFNCEGCGIKESHKVLFGYSVNIEYGCGMRPTNVRELNEKSVIFVSFLGTIHNLR